MALRLRGSTPSSPDYSATCGGRCSRIDLAPKRGSANVVRLLWISVSDASNPLEEMMSVIEVKVPDIGDFKDVPVIEVFVKPGDPVKAEDPLVTLESDKATMDVPSPAAGTVKELKVKLGDKVSEGRVILTMDAAAAGAQ